MDPVAKPVRIHTPVTAEVPIAAPELEPQSSGNSTSLFERVAGEGIRKAFVPYIENAKNFGAFLTRLAGLQKKTQTQASPTATVREVAEATPGPSNAPDFVNVGMGPTGMVAMLAAIANGKSAAGIELRGDPTRGVLQNYREDFYHLLGEIDAAMLDRYGEEGIPRLPDGNVFKLADVFFHPEKMGGGSGGGFHKFLNEFSTNNQVLAGRIHRISIEDAREKTREEHNGKSVLYDINPPRVPPTPDGTKMSEAMDEVLDKPSMFQASLGAVELMLRTYLRGIQSMDDDAGRAPRVTLYESHRVVQEEGGTAGYYANGTSNQRRMFIEKVERVTDESGRTQTQRKPGTGIIDLGTPQLFAATVGANGGKDAEALGFKQTEVVHTNPVTKQSVVGQQTWLAAALAPNIGGQLMRRVSTATDPNSGEKQTVRQIAVGVENAPDVGWVLVQVPEWKTFDPIDAGVVPPDTDPTSQEFAEAARNLVKDFYFSQAAELLHMDPETVPDLRMFYGPALFTLKEKVGDSAAVADNGVVAGDLMGNGHFLTSGGTNVGVVGHGRRFMQFWRSTNGGAEHEDAMASLSAGIKEDTLAWLRHSSNEFFDVAPVNFGKEAAKVVDLHAEEEPLPEARQADFGLQGVLTQGSWAKAFADLRDGKFKDAVVPEHQVNITEDPNMEIRTVGVSK